MTTNETMPTNEPLKPCPFCGSTEIIFDYPCMKCRACAAEGPYHSDKNIGETSESAARRWWNQREGEAK